MVYGLTGAGIAVQNVGINSVRGIAFNTVYGCTGIGIDGTPGTAPGNQKSSELYVLSNIVKDVGGEGIQGYAGGSNGWAKAELIDNFIHGTGTAITGVWTAESGNRPDVDPLLQNAAGAQFNLQSSSLAKDYTSGNGGIMLFQQLYGLSLARDYLGTTRPSGSHFDSGATEQ